MPHDTRSTMQKVMDRQRSSSPDDAHYPHHLTANGEGITHHRTITKTYFGGSNRAHSKGHEATGLDIFGHHRGPATEFHGRKGE
jgi:hypothetical protein